MVEYLILIQDKVQIKHKLCYHQHMDYYNHNHNIIKILLHSNIGNGQKVNHLIIRHLLLYHFVRSGNKKINNNLSVIYLFIINYLQILRIVHNLSQVLIIYHNYHQYQYQDNIKMNIIIIVYLILLIITIYPIVYLILIIILINNKDNKIIII